MAERPMEYCPFCGTRLEHRYHEEEKREIYQTCREEVKQIYERIQIFDASSSETDAEAE